MFVLRSFVLTVFCFSSLVFGQMCREYSETCNDDDSCCGGCCLGGVCMATYQDCRVKQDLCLDAYCPPDEECYVYIPEGCLGCGPIRACRSAFTSGETHFPTTEHHLHDMWHSSSGHLIDEKIVTFVSLMFLYRF
ncbi:unnamed protein product [Callosobruchus maculatus]|uniref:Uncharacterized protein n=1 Tax=Callosobruchus maculatus TaxID=64391 RepID=A0A653D899_CALMS|nr:unnamed protein product [Callosobruchus maculatus]